MLNVEAIFNSIDGEYNGFRGAGELTTFIRLKQCNLSCTYCDTMYSQDSKPGKLGQKTVEEIANLIKLEKVTITGGEPLLQKECVDLIEILLKNGHKITVETNGSIEIPNIHYYSPDWHLFDRLRFVVDYKLPSSGMNDHMNPSIFTKLGPQDAIKFVIADWRDYHIATMFIHTYDLSAKLVFSPAVVDQHDYTGWPAELASALVENAEQLSNVSYSLQIHKVLFPDAKSER